MKKCLLNFSRILVLAAVFCLANAVRAEIVYNNSSNFLGVGFNPGLFEVGDEVVLDGTARTLTEFTFEYYGLNFSGDEQARVRFYANDGTNSPAGPQVPFTLLFDSDWFGIAETNRATLMFTDFITGAALPLTTDVPDSFTWTIQFSGTDGLDEAAGLTLYSPPTVGDNYLEYWDNTGGFNWEYRSMIIDGTNGPGSFGAVINAVPEPSALALGLLGGLAFLGLRWRRGRR